MGKPSTKNKILAILVGGGTLLVLLGVIVSMIWSAVSSTTHTWHEIAVKQAEAARVSREETKKRAALQVPLATITAATPTTQPTQQISGTANAKPAEKVAPIPLAILNESEPSSQSRPAPPSAAKPKPEPKAEPVPLATITGKPASKASKNPLNLASFPVLQAGGKPSSLVVAVSPATKPYSTNVSLIPVPQTEVGAKNSTGIAKLSQPHNDKTAPIALGVIPAGNSLRHGTTQPVLKFQPTEMPELLKPITLSIGNRIGVVELAGLPTTISSKIAGLQIATLEKIKAQLPPTLEVEREKSESAIPAEQDVIRIVTGFDSSTPLNIEKISPTHFAVSITTDSTLKNWFMFRIEGARGKTVRVDIKDAPLGKWWSLNPVYSYVESPDKLESFEIKQVEKSGDLIKAYNGPLLPDTSGQKWHYVSQVWNQDSGPNSTGTFCFVQRYEADCVYVAMRCPYTVEYNTNYVDSLKRHASVKVCTVGKSEKGRPLTIIQVGDSDPATVPCLIIYAREHGSENDTSWVVKGAIDFLLSDAAVATRLRKNLTLLAIPVLDPDASALSLYEGITEKFIHSADVSREAIAYANFFKRWVDSGNRLDITIDLHNVESAEGEHIFCPVIEPAAKRSESCKAIHALIVQALGDADYSAAAKPLGSRTAPFRMGGYLAQMYGPLFMPYELNSQQRSRHLTLGELENMGRILTETSAKFCVSQAGHILAADVATVRQAREERMASFGSPFQKRGIDNALQIEWILWRRELIEKSSGKRTRIESENGKVAHD